MYPIDHFEHGIFAFRTTIAHSVLYFENISRNATVYHHETGEILPLFEGENTFQQHGTYIIEGGFVTVRATAGETVFDFANIHTPFLHGEVLAWEGTGTQEAIHLFAKSNLLTAPELPETVTDVRGLFQSAKTIPDVTNWDVSHIESMESMFEQAEFHQDIGGWDTSNVVNMQRMFARCTKFNHDIGAWDTSNVQHMAQMFYDAQDFNNGEKLLGYWDTGNVENMFAMFSDAVSFNQDIGSWDVSRVQDMTRLFAHATEFNQDISQWNTSALRSATEMFYNAPRFNQPIGDWDMRKVYDISRMFYHALDFDQNLSTWDFPSATRMLDVFSAARSFTNGGEPLVWEDRIVERGLLR